LPSTTAGFALGESYHALWQCRHNIPAGNDAQSDPRCNLIPRTTTANAELSFWINNADFDARRFNVWEMSF
jgi:hypothetical protein